MASGKFLGLDASSDGETPVVQNVKGHGIVHSHGENWFRRRMIRHGAGGSVYLVDRILFRGFSSQMAVKSALMIHSFSLRREKNVYSDLNGNSNLVYCYGDEITEEESGKRTYNLLMEYCSGGSLDDHITQSTNGLPEVEVASFARDIAQGLEYMHANGYAHCDIKPENILLVPETACSSGKVKYAAKIADFGLSLNTFEGDEDSFMVRGTLGYMAPEMIRGVEIGFPADIWSYGCTVLEMLTGERAWGAELMEKTDQEVMEYIGDSYESPKIPDYISEKAKDFLRKCLDPVCGYNRWSASMLLEHPFLSETAEWYCCCRH